MSAMKNGRIEHQSLSREEERRGNRGVQIKENAIKGRDGVNNTTREMHP